jgi:transcriptional regulator with PAS, ATPase and Fis domain
MLTLIFNAFSDGVIAVDNDLEILRMNKTASAMLGLDGRAVLGKRLNSAVELEDTLIKALTTKNYFSGVETAFQCPLGTRTFICSIDPVRDHSGHILGAIIRMSEKRQLMSIAKRISGNYAKYHFEDIMGNDPALLRQIELAKIAARTNSRILIIGKSGTGKELFAQAIHNHSSRQMEPFVAISCAAIPRDLIESELFGYRRGAFTGAHRDGHVGKFEFANRGTLFLDDINRLPLDLQAKLLRVLQQNEIVRLGDSVPIPVDVRVIAASNTDLLTEVEQQNFREDLYYRINVVEIFIPSLRERREDLDLLIDHITQRQWQEMGGKKPRISEKVMKILRDYPWPGNIRELENCMERAMLLSQGNTIQENHLPERIRKTRDGHAQDIMTLHQSQREMIEGTLLRCGGNVSRTARELKIARSTLYRKMKAFGLRRNESLTSKK